MEYKELKQISIVDFLSGQGMAPAQKTADYYKYIAPGRDEKTPSLTVYHKKNDWCDYGSHQGGDIGKLIQYLFQCDASKALNILNEYAAKNSLSPCTPAYNHTEQEPATENRIEIVEVIEITHWHLKNYLHSRKITLSTASRYVKEAHYNITGTANDKPLHSLAFRNDKGGYVFRHKGQKKPISTKPAHYTTIEIQDSKQLNIFEGFIDFLSALEFYKLQQPTHTTIVLNSLSNLKEVIPVLTNYAKINLFLDNDPKSQSGQKAAEQISKLHPCTVNHAERIYPGFKDFNDFICCKPIH